MNVRPLLLASGQFIAPVLFVGFPAAFASVICFVVAWLLKRKKQQVHQGEQSVLTVPRILNIAGLVFVAVALFSPSLERFLT
jgi:hypothetical protein